MILNVFGMEKAEKQYSPLHSGLYVMKKILTNYSNMESFYLCLILFFLTMQSYGKNSCAARIFL